MSEKEKAPLLS